MKIAFQLTMNIIAGNLSCAVLFFISFLIWQVAGTNYFFKKYI